MSLLLGVFGDSTSQREKHSLCCSLMATFIFFFSAIPVQAAYNSKHVAIVITARGGHIGFLEGLFPLLHEQYMCRLFTQYFAAVFEYGSDLIDTIKKSTNTSCIA
jgi:hypothetical protein